MTKCQKVVKKSLLLEQKLLKREVCDFSHYFHTSVIFGFTPESFSTNSQDTVFDTLECRKDSYLLALAITLGDPNEAYLVCGIVMNRRGSSILTL